MKLCADCHPCSLCTRSADAPNVARGARPSDRPCEGRGGCKRGRGPGWHRPRVTRLPPTSLSGSGNRLAGAASTSLGSCPRPLSAERMRPCQRVRTEETGPDATVQGGEAGAATRHLSAGGRGGGGVSSEVGEAGGGDSDINPPGPQVTERAPDGLGLGSGDGGGGAML